MADEALRTTTFILTRADALAYEQASFRMTPLGVLALLLWLGLCGAAALFLPPEWSGPQLGWAALALAAIAMAIAYVLAMILISLRQWLKARRRIKRTIELIVTEWPERLEITGDGLPHSIAFADIRVSRLTRTHLLLTMDESVLILPRRAYSEDGAIEALADRIAGDPIRCRSRQPLLHPRRLTRLRQAPRALR